MEMIKKLVCDRCGLQLTDREDIYLALEGKWAWETATRARGAEPRGMYPCENYMHCGGELRVVFSWRGRLMNMVRKGNY